MPPTGDTERKLGQAQTSGEGSPGEKKKALVLKPHIYSKKKGIPHPYSPTLRLLFILMKSGQKLAPLGWGFDRTAFEAY